MGVMVGVRRRVKRVKRVKRRMQGMFIELILSIYISRIWITSLCRYQYHSKKAMKVAN